MCRRNQTKVLTDYRAPLPDMTATNAEESRRLKGDLTGDALSAAMQASPYRDIDIEPRRAPMPVRAVAL
jgi:hypothetical protein